MPRSLGLDSICRLIITLSLYDVNMMCILLSIERVVDKVHRDLPESTGVRSLSLPCRRQRFSLGQLACSVGVDAILAWHARLVPQVAAPRLSPGDLLVASVDVICSCSDQVASMLCQFRDSAGMQRCSNRCCVYPYASWMDREYPLVVCTLIKGMANEDW